MSTRRATKIVATLGPASSDPDLLEKMIRAGVNVVRLNFSHGKAQDHIDRATLVRAAAQRAGREVAIMADLQGPKIRVGKFAEGKVMLEPGMPFVLDASRTELGDLQGVGLDYKELPRDVKAGDVLLLNDGLIVLTVTAVRGEQVHTVVKLGGELSNNKGINKQGGGLTAPALTAKDMEDIRTAMSFQADYVAVSFPKNATDMEMARQLCNVAAAEYRHKPGLIAKIERAEAIPRLEEILAASDGIMVARGDLAVEVGNAVVPALQKRMIRLARDNDKVVITATQMMESMITNPVPTRAEVSDVANAVLDGTDAVMLSAETAAGKYPLETVEEMAKICSAAEAAEEVELEADFMGKSFNRIDQSIAMGALFTAHHLGAKAIVAMTDSGSTALWMSRHRIHVPIYALTTKVATQRRMALFRNVRPLLMDTSGDRDTALVQAEAHLKKRSIVDSGDVYVITCDETMGAPGGTNMLKICRVRLSLRAPDARRGARGPLGRLSGHGVAQRHTAKISAVTAGLPSRGLPACTDSSLPPRDLHHVSRFHARTAGPRRGQRLRHSGLQRQQSGTGSGRHGGGRRSGRSGHPAGQRRCPQVRR